MVAASIYALGRLAYSGGLIFVPEKISAGWLGPDAAARPATHIALRGLAARDAALALGALGATVTGRSPRLWLLLCALGDAADLAATLIAPPAELPDNARVGTIALAGGSALLGAGLALRSRA
ncbi:MAG: hypothetical protein ACR2KV_05710 [Solirubrobacteraceae bacterium]